MVMVNTYLCEKCGHKSVYFRGTNESMTGICNKPNCRALYTRDMVFICFDKENNIKIHYNRDGSVELTKATIKRLTEDSVEVIQKRLLDVEENVKETVQKNELLKISNNWWISLSSDEKISVYKNRRVTC
jgi:hypothetical protein